MKLLILLALVSVAFGYKSYINVAGRNVIGTGRGALSSAELSSLRNVGKGLSGSLSSGLVSPVKKYKVPLVTGSLPPLSLPAPAPVVQVAAPVQPEYVAQVIEQAPIEDSFSAVAAPVLAAPAPQLVAAAPQLTYAAAPQLSYSAAPQISAAPQLSLASLGGLSGAYDVAPRGGVITAAVQTRYRLQYVDVPSTGGPAQPQQIVIPASAQPLEISFQSQSSPVRVKQVHIPGQASAPQFSSHQEEPDILKQEIVKPVIQEITEAIQPVRKITQEVRPVLEQINQILTRGQKVQTTQAVTTQPALSQIAAPAFTAAPQLSVRPVAQISASQLTALKPISVSLIGLAKPNSAALAGLSRPAQSFGGSIIGTVVAQPLEQTQQIEQQLIDKKAKAKAAA